jgi:hypothetical protein
MFLNYFKKHVGCFLQSMWPSLLCFLFGSSFSRKFFIPSLEFLIRKHLKKVLNLAKKYKNYNGNLSIAPLGPFRGGGGGGECDKQKFNFFLNAKDKYDLWNSYTTHCTGQASGILKWSL